MKVVAAFFLAMGWVSGQVTMPNEGWRMVEKGEGKSEGTRVLGSWQNEEGTVLVGAAWDSKMPGLMSLFDLPPMKNRGPGDDPPPHWPKAVELIEDPLVGFWIDFASYGNEELGERRHYWLFDEKGGVFLKVFVREGAEFDPGEWGIGKPTPDRLPACRAQVKKAIETIEKIKVPPTIRIDPNLRPAVNGGKVKANGKEIVIEITEGGTYRMKGEKLDLKSLEVLLEAEARKLGPGATLKIRALPRVEFKFVQRAIKAGAKAGLKKVAYASFSDDVEQEKE